MTTVVGADSLLTSDEDERKPTDHAVDVRWRRVLDKAGEDTGPVDDLLVDNHEDRCASYS